MGFQDAAFLYARFSVTFLKNSGRGQSLRTTTCPETVVGVNKGILPAKFFHSNKASFYVS